MFVDKDVELIEARFREAETVWTQREADKAAAAAIPLAEKIASVRIGKRDTREGVQYSDRKMPVSHSLPLVKDPNFTTATAYGQTIRLYKDGTRTDTLGRRIVETKADLKAVEKAGFVRDNS